VLSTSSLSLRVLKELYFPGTKFHVLAIKILLNSSFRYMRAQKHNLWRGTKRSHGFEGESRKLLTGKARKTEVEGGR